MQIAIQEIRFIEMKASAKKRIEKAQQESLCVACLQPLDKTRVVRGCHERCYRATLRLVADGKTSFSERQQQGKILDRGKVGPKFTNPVSIDVDS